MRWPARGLVVVRTRVLACWAVSTVGLEAHHIFPLEQACDRPEVAREILHEKGMMFEDRLGQPRPRPETAIEHAAMLDLAKLCRDVGLDDPQKILRQLCKCCCTSGLSTQLRRVLCKPVSRNCVQTSDNHSLSSQ